MLLFTEVCSIASSAERSPSRTDKFRDAAIIYGFLDILDEEKEAEAEVAAMHEGRGLGSGTNTDEESHIKRRASPTSLSGPSLHKRPSIKITRGPPMKVEGEETHRTSSGLSNETSLEEDPVRRSMDTD